MRISAILFFLILLLLLAGSRSAVAATHRVSSSDAIEELIESQSLQPGDEVIWANGVYRNQEIELNGIDGTAEQPLTLRAEQPGGVVLRGESQLRINSKWWVISGFHFDGSQGGPNAYNAIQFRGSGDVGAEHVRLTDCAFTSLDNGEETSKWVQIYGRFNRVDHCHFVNKSNKGALVTVELDALADDESAQHVIERNYFADVKFNKGSDNETIRIGFSGDQNKPARCEVRENLFVRCSGENEIISNKSSFNRYSTNVFRECNGALVLRHGHHVTVDGNVFMGDGAADAGGIRINDSHHRIFNNYMQDLTGLTWNAPLSIEGGKKLSGGDSSGYQAVDDVTIVHNSIIHCAKGIYLSSKHGKRSPTGVIANNLVVVDDAKKPIVDAELSTEKLKWTQNLFFGSSLVPEGIAGLRVDPQLIHAGNFLRPGKGSPVVDAAADGFEFVTKDVDRQPRTVGQCDVGADEVVSGDDTRPLLGSVSDLVVLRNEVGVSYLDSLKTPESR